ncbi:MAG: hypothetical protein QOE31_2352, partial [Solirubrobacteraceae bacterium]|nr:hypothetical protein [Solirubrobacteraceae bacterium]
STITGTLGGRRIRIDARSAGAAASAGLPSRAALQQQMRRLRLRSIG